MKSIIKIFLAIAVAGSCSSQTAMADEYSKHNLEVGMAGMFTTFTQKSDLVSANRYSIASGIPLHFNLDYMYEANRHLQFGGGLRYALPVSYQMNYTNNSIADASDLQENVKTSYLNVSGKIRYLFSGNSHIRPYAEVQAGYNFKPWLSGYAFSMQLADRSYLTPDHRVLEKKGGLSLGLGFGVFVSKHLKIGLGYLYDSYKMNAFVNTNEIASNPAKIYDSEEGMLQTYKYNTYSYTFSIGYLINLSPSRHRELPSAEEVKHEGLRLSVGTMYGGYRSRYHHEGEFPTRLMASNLECYYAPKSPTFVISAEYLFPVHHVIDLGLGMEYATPTKYAWENRVEGIVQGTPRKKDYWFSFKQQSLKPYGFIQFNLTAIPLTPYFKVKAGYAFSFVNSFSKEGDEERENIDVTHTNGVYAGGGLGCSFSQNMGLELSFDTSYMGFVRNYDAPNNKGELISQHDTCKSWLLAAGLKLFYNF